jgi:NAD(P)-dependent dehydrogenase (short-subunit alcohol dehydrogenase family)
VTSALSGRHAIVTGGGRGIGLAIARGLLAHGATVTLVSRDRSRLEKAAASLTGRVEIEVADVADPGQVSDAFAAIAGRTGPADILVNNAGQALSAPLGKSDIEFWQQMLAVNLTGTYLCTQQVLPAMLKAGHGRIVNVASTAGLTGYAYCTAYCAAKHGVVGFTRALAREVARTRITVNAVCPGYTETDIVRDAVANIRSRTGRSEEEAVASLVASNPQGRLVQPDEVANAVTWLCLPGSDSVNGQSIGISGGETQ